VKHKLVFDTADAQSIAASDKVGAFVTAADGTLITATGTSLDANITNASIAVTATDLDIRNLVFATDKVDVSGSEVSLDAATLAALETITVVATDLDIRDLDAATDSVQSNTHDGAGTAITSTSGALDVNIKSSDITIDVDITNGAEFAEDSAHTTADIGNHVLAVRQDTLAASVDADGDYASFKVNDVGSLYTHDTEVLAQLIAGVTVVATDLDIRDLDATQDNVAISDGTDTLAINADGSINTVASDAALANTAVLASAASSTTTSGTLGLALANRKYLTLYNNGNKIVFVGQSGVTTANGFPIFPGSLIDMRLGAAVALHSVAEAGTQELRALELS
jgi:hypothetical protein